MPVKRDNPYANYNFVVELGGEEVGGFSEVDLPAATIETIEYREGGDKVSSVRKLPGRVSYANVDRVLRIAADGIRREGAVLEQSRFDAVLAAARNAM